MLQLKCSSIRFCSAKVPLMEQDTFSEASCEQLLSTAPEKAHGEGTQQGGRGLTFPSCHSSVRAVQVSLEI